MAQTIPYHNHDLEQPVSPLQTEFSSFPGRRASRKDGEYAGLPPVSPIMSRRTSCDSDRYSTGSGLTSNFPSNPTNVNPAPAYVGSFGASQVVSEHQASQELPSSDTDDEDDKKNKGDVRFSEGALALVNAFLDQLLYSFLSTSRSTSLLALRPAVTEVLKHRLAKEAIRNADTELAELLAGVDEEEEIDTKHRSQEEKRSWDLELVWKRTRLRVMVYMRLGEMEDDDEQRYVQQEELFYGSERRFTSSTGLVSWSAAIFLTSVLECVAEQTLQVAGQAAYSRKRRQTRNHRRSMSSDAVVRGDLVVEEYDVEKVALNSTLGRLWRTWRKALRNNGVSTTPIQPLSSVTSRTSRENTASAMDQRRSFSTPRDGSVANDSRPISRDQQDDIPEMQYPEHVLAANIPLPISDHARDIDEIVIPGLARDPDTEYNQEDSPEGPYPDYMLAVLVPLPLVDQKRDVDEIEVPGLARDPDAESDDKEGTSKQPMRRKSSTGYLPCRTSGGLPAPDNSTLSSPSQMEMPFFGRERSTSLPTPVRTPMAVEEPLEDMPSCKKEFAEHQDKQEPDTEEVPKEMQAAEVADNAIEGPEPETTARTPKPEFPWMTTGAAAGASGAAVAAAAWASNSAKGVSTPSAQSPYPKNITEAEDVKETPGIPGSWTEVGNDASPQSPSEKDIEELDKRKSLLDIKQMMIVNGASGETSGQQSPEVVESQTPPIARTASNESFSLGTEEKQEQTSAGEGLQNSMGVVSSSEAIDTRKALSSDADTQQARERSHRPAELIISDSTPASQDSPTKQTSTPRTPRQFLDLTSEAESSTEQPLPSAVNASHSPELTNGAVQETSANKLPTENDSLSRSSAPSIHKKQSSDSTGVQEHPIVQRMASLKRSEPSSSSESEKAVPFTSASIRGPEDFDLFVQGGETLKYTLTPEHVRDDPVSKLISFASVGTDVREVDNQTRYANARESPVEMDATPATRQVPSPSDTRKGRPPVAAGQTSSAEKRRSLSRPSPTNTNTHRMSGLMAREPRVMTESTRDFADFIRSTGPNKDAAIFPILANASSTSLHSLRSAHIRGASASRSSSPGADRSRALRDDGDVPPVPPIPRRATTGMEARGAKAVTDGNADLIDFIRSGPRKDGEHRISRTVAPFRTTMDSDQFNDLNARRSVDGQADPSARTTPSLKSSSHRTSANSRSALLNGSQAVSQAVQPNQNGQTKGLSEDLTAGSKGVAPQIDDPTRKRYRKKDPYAIDFDDEDDDFVINAPKASRKDESLMEFLSNHDPPSNGAPRPLIDPNSAQARRIINNARAGNQSADGKARTVTNNPGPRTGSQPSTQFAPSTQQAQINSTVTSSKPRLEARSPGSKSRFGTSVLNTNDLADFIRNSGPPDDPNTAPAPFVGRGSKLTLKEEEKGRKKAEKKKRGSFFSRTRYQRYLDMP